MTKKDPQEMSNPFDIKLNFVSLGTMMKWEDDNIHYRIHTGVKDETIVLAIVKRYTRETLGWIDWDITWKKYCVRTLNNSLFTPYSLKSIAGLCDELTDIHYELLRARKKYD